MERVKRRWWRCPVITVPLYYAEVLDCQPPERIYEAVRSRIDADSHSIDQFLDGLAPWLYGAELAAVPRLPANMTEPFWDNGWFGIDDARALYSIIRAHAPKRFLEVGTGNSTKFACKAIREGRTGTEVVTIDPQPRSNVDEQTGRWINRNIWKVDIGEFRRLEAGDVLFMDGSHLVLNGSDVVRFFLEILPIVRPGVLIHVHDIHLPYEYSPEFDNRGYGEQYMLANALLNNPNLVVLLPVAYLTSQGRLKEGGGSFWFMKRA